MEKPLLTVVIPVYNTAQYLPRCIETVINQTIKNLNIIIVNDGSTDDSEKIIKKAMENHSNISYIKLKKNIGVGNARNLGIKKATTEYIAFLDSDDWIDAAYYEKMIKAIIEDKSDVCISGIKTEINDIYGWTYRYRYPSHFTVDGDFCLHSLTHQYNHDIYISPIVNNKIYRKNVLTENKLWFDKSRRAQDLFFSFLIFTFVNKVSICHDAFYHYYQRRWSATHNFSKQYIDDYFFILQKLKHELKTIGIYKCHQKDFECYVNLHITKLIKNMFNNIQNEIEQKAYITYIIRQAITVIPLETLLDYIDIGRFKKFWTI